MDGNRISKLVIFLVLLSGISTLLEGGVTSNASPGYANTEIHISSNDCGNKLFPVNALCQNLKSTTSGNENTINVAGIQNPSQQEQIPSQISLESMILKIVKVVHCPRGVL
jgi:hypothetical protein